MTPEKLQILQHAVGADQYGNPPKYDSRNYFCAGKSDEQNCRELVAEGLMIRHATTVHLPYFNCSVTDEGRKAMREASSKVPKPSRSSLRFAEYISFADAYECTFREWLDIRKTDWYKGMKGSI